MFRRQQTVYVAVDPFFSPRGKVLHGFGEFLDGLAEAQIPSVWVTSATRAQLDEPRRRLGQNDPYIGESGCGVYLPEDYFHLKPKKTVRMGRYTCIPVAKPQPAAAEALEEIAADLGTAVVPLRGLSPRELSQNTGLPPKEAEAIRMRDFDELFFFAGAAQAEIAEFAAEAKARRLVLQTAGAFWSLSCGADVATCVRELGGLYDRALRGHAVRVGITLAARDEDGAITQPLLPSGGLDRILFLTERIATPESQGDGPSEIDDAEEELSARKPGRARNHFHLRAAGVWDEVLGAIVNKP